MYLCSPVDVLHWHLVQFYCPTTCVHCNQRYAEPDIHRLATLTDLITGMSAPKAAPAVRPYVSDGLRDTTCHLRMSEHETRHHPFDRVHNGLRTAYDCIWHKPTGVPADAML